ncbi:MAG: hypothetical protein ACIAQ0_08390 [Phycisphaerales bacterium JB058]
MSQQDRRANSSQPQNLTEENPKCSPRKLSVESQCFANELANNHELVERLCRALRKALSYDEHGEDDIMQYVYDAIISTAKSVDNGSAPPDDDAAFLFVAARRCAINEGKAASQYRARFQQLDTTFAIAENAPCSRPNIRSEFGKVESRLKNEEVEYVRRHLIARHDKHIAEQLNVKPYTISRIRKAIMKSLSDN